MTKDYNAKLAQDYEDIRAKVRGGMLPLVARIPEIDKAVSAYVLAQDEHYEELRRKAAEEGGDASEAVPIQLRDATALHRMADLVLHEELTWSHPDKMSIVEYPVMSEWQAESRRGLQMSVADMEYGDRRGQGRRKTHFTDDFGAPQVCNNKMAHTTDPGVDEAVIDADLMAAIERAGLTKRQRQIIELLYFDNMTQEDVSLVAGISRRTVRSTHDDAILKIQGEVSRH